MIFNRFALAALAVLPNAVAQTALLPKDITGLQFELVGTGDCLDASGKIYDAVWTSYQLTPTDCAKSCTAPGLPLDTLVGIDHFTHAVGNTDGKMCLCRYDSQGAPADGGPEGLRVAIGYGGSGPIVSVSNNRPKQDCYKVVSPGNHLLTKDEAVNRFYMPLTPDNFFKVGFGGCRPSVGARFDEAYNINVVGSSEDPLLCIDKCAEADALSLVAFHVNGEDGCSCHYKSGTRPDYWDAFVNDGVILRIGDAPATATVIAIGDGGVSHVCYTFLGESYKVGTPGCYLNGAIGNIDCYYRIAAPDTASVTSSLFIAVDGECTEDLETDVTSGASSGLGDYQVALDFSQVPADSFQNPYTFCVKTELKDSSDQVMHYQEQFLTITQDLNADFSISSFDTTLFTNGGTDAVERASSVVARRINQDGSAAGNPLESGSNLFIEIDASSVGSGWVIDAVSSFTVTKDNTPYDLIASNGQNTFYVGLQSQVTTVITTLPSSIFATTGTASISGSVTLAAATGRRYLARITQEVSAGEEESADFNLEVEIVPNEASSAAKASFSLGLFFGVMAFFLF